MPASILADWFTHHPLGRYTAQREHAFFNEACPIIRDNEIVLQLSLPEWQLPHHTQTLCLARNLHAQLLYLPFADNSIDHILLPHTLEQHPLPELLLAEVARILHPQGSMLLTGFNPHSLWRFSRLFGQHLPPQQRCLPLNTLKPLLNNHDLCIEQGRFMVYLPAVSTVHAVSFWHFMELAGNRWWPHAAAVYGLVLSKRQPGMRLTPEWKNRLATISTVTVGQSAATTRNHESL